MQKVLSGRVARGVALLNSKVPDWRDSVNPDTLNLSNGFSCVLAQLFGSYEIGLKKLNLTAAQGRDHGFEVGSIHRLLPLIHGSGKMYEVLTAWWSRELIRFRPQVGMMA